MLSVLFKYETWVSQRRHFRFPLREASFKFCRPCRCRGIHNFPLETISEKKMSGWRGLKALIFWKSLVRQSMTLGYTGNVFPPKQTTTMSGLYLNILEIIFCQGSEAVIPSNPNDSTTVDAKWTKKSKTNPYRDFKDDDDQVTKNKRRTAQQKSTTLDLMLGQIANDCPVIYRNVIAKKSLNPWSRFCSL